MGSYERIDSDEPLNGHVPVPAWSGYKRRSFSKGRLVLPAVFAVLSALLLVSFSALGSTLDMQSLSSVEQHLEWSKQQPKAVSWHPHGAIEAYRFQPSGQLVASSPATVMPFYLRGRKAGSVDLDSDVTVFSMATENRLDMVKMAAEQYQGVLSLAYSPPISLRTSAQVRYLSHSGYHPQTRRPEKPACQSCGIW